MGRGTKSILENRPARIKIYFTEPWQPASVQELKWESVRRTDLKPKIRLKRTPPGDTRKLKKLLLGKQII